MGLLPLVLLLPALARAEYLPLPGPGPVAPAPALPGGSGRSSGGLVPSHSRGYARDIRQAKQDAASVIGVAPGHVHTDRGASPGQQSIGPLAPSGSQPQGRPRPDAPALTTNFNGISYTQTFPPDPVIAAGPSNLVLATNGSVTIRDKTGALIASTSLETFFSSVSAVGENLVFDPRVLFDMGSARFFLSATGQIDNPRCSLGTCVSHFFLAVSKSSSPTTTGSSDWYLYAFDATLDGSTVTTNWADFPGLGVDGTTVVLTANMFSFRRGVFQRAKIRILNKSVLIVGGAVTWTDFVGMTDPSTGLLSFSLQPALTFGSPGTFFLASASSTVGSCNIVVWGIANPLSSPTLSRLPATAGGTCNDPPAAAQLGGGTPLDTGDNRLLNLVYRNGSLWTAQPIAMNFGSGNVSAARWVQIAVSGWPGAVSFTQDSTFGADAIWYFYPTVMVDASNNLGIILARSSASEYGSAYYTARQGTDPPDTLQPSALLKAGMANQNLKDSSGLNRYGDYLGISLDPNDGSFWMLGEYVVSFHAWGTWVGNFALPVLAVTPSSQDFGIVNVGSAADETFTVQNAGGGTLSGTAATAAPFSIVSGGSFSLGPVAGQPVVVRFSPAAVGTFAGSVNFTSNGGNDSRPVTGTGRIAPLSLHGLVPSVLAPQPAGTAITWMAVTSGGIPPVQYQLWVEDPTGDWTIGQDWAAVSTWTWTPATPGVYRIQVRTRSAGETSYDASLTSPPYTITVASGSAPAALSVAAAAGRLATAPLPPAAEALLAVSPAPSAAVTSLPGGPAAGQSQTPLVPSSSQLTFQQVVPGLDRPVAITHAGDGSGRLFITLQGGKVVIYNGSQVLATPFLDITSLVSCCGEQGLLSVAIHPNYAGKGYLYVNYTNRSGNTVIARYTVSTDPNIADAGSAAILLTIPQPFSNHNGGQLQFGPDGYLYIGMGDGGSAGDPGNRAQNLGELLGKMLRIDVNGGTPYAIPPTNPFRSMLGAQPEIWAYGLRNPWRFSFDRLTGDQFIGDVGQDSREEVDFQPAGSRGGQNYGWRLMEGTICYNPPSGCNDGTLVLPILDYPHLNGDCSITGGYRYRGARFPELYGVYLYGDYCSGHLWGATPNGSGGWTTTQLLDTPYSITTFGEDQAGEIYLAHYAAGSGAIYRIARNPPVAILTLSKAGTGAGRMTSSPGGINCSTTCSAPFDSGTMVTVTATPDTDARFAGWAGGGCSGTGPCTVTMTADAAITATFNLPLSLHGLIPSPPGPQPTGTPITWTAVTSGGIPPAEYQFLVEDPTGAWNVGRDWAAVSTWTWTPPAPGVYRIHVRARSTGAGSYEASLTSPPYTITAASGPAAAAG